MATQFLSQDFRQWLGDVPVSEVEQEGWFLIQDEGGAERLSLHLLSLPVGEWQDLGLSGLGLPQNRNDVAHFCSH